MNDSVSYTEMKSLFEQLRMVDIIDQYEELTKQATQEKWEYERYFSYSHFSCVACFVSSSY